MDKSYNTTDVAAKLEGIQGQGLEPYYDEAFLKDYIQKLRDEDAGNFSFSWYPHNAPGEWMGQNIARPNTVMSQPATVESVTEELEANKPEYLVLASYLGGYATFKEISEYTRRNHPNTKIVAASVGALVEETQQYADHLVKGDQVTDLRRIIGEPAETPLRPVTVHADTRTQFHGQTKESDFGLLISGLGCPYGCDFCPSTAQFGRQFMSPFSAEQVRDAIIEAKETIAPQDEAFTISVAEPQGLGDIKLWKEIFLATRDLPFVCDLVTTTSSKIIDKYDLDELTQGNMRLTTVNIGVESLLQGYAKNKNVDLKRLFNKLQGSGISVVSTFIVGFDWQNKQNVIEEAKLLRELDSDGYILANLEMQPGTPIYNAYKQAGRLHDVPPQLLNFYGYQAFDHPHFRSGFNDMLPLMSAVEEVITDENQVFASSLRTYLNRRNDIEASKRRAFLEAIDTFKSGLAPGLSESEAREQIDRYTAELYFTQAFRQMDLFHPFILSTN
jgi:biotin synthase-like enzyme